MVDGMSNEKKRAKRLALMLPNRIVTDWKDSETMITLYDILALMGVGVLWYFAVVFLLWTVFNIHLESIFDETDIDQNTENKDWLRQIWIKTNN